MRALRTCSVALLATVTPLLGGCSGDPQADYCEVVESHQEELTTILGEGGPDALLRALPVFRDLHDAAPSDVRDDWQVVVSGLTGLQTALDDADVDPATYDRDTLPQGVTDAERDRIDAAAEKLTTEESVAAFAAVEQQARDVCKTPLRL